VPWSEWETRWREEWRGAGQWGSGGGGGGGGGCLAAATRLRRTRLHSEGGVSASGSCTHRHSLCLGRCTAGGTTRPPRARLPTQRALELPSCPPPWSCGHARAGSRMSTPSAMLAQGPSRARPRARTHTEPRVYILAPRRARTQPSRGATDAHARRSPSHLIRLLPCGARDVGRGLRETERRGGWARGCPRSPPRHAPRPPRWAVAAAASSCVGDGDDGEGSDGWARWMEREGGSKAVTRGRVEWSVCYARALGRLNHVLAASFTLYLCIRIIADLIPDGSRMSYLMAGRLFVQGGKVSIQQKNVLIGAEKVGAVR
jgi:hypothetical protein